jgi:hypothetical protein
MTKTIYCKNRECGRCIRVEGATQGGREVLEHISCPYCEYPNEVKWPVGEGFLVIRCDGDEIPHGSVR